VTSSGIQPATFQLVVWYLNQLRYRLIPLHCSVSYHPLTFLTFSVHKRNEFCEWMVGTPASYLEYPGLKSHSRDRVSWQAFRDFSQSLQTNVSRGMIWGTTLKWDHERSLQHPFQFTCRPTILLHLGRATIRVFKETINKCLKWLMSSRSRDYDSLILISS
jgi:hypothetical protein